MTIQAHTAVILLLAALCGCEQWPPNEKEFVDQFHQHRRDIEQLKATLEASKYWSVSVDSFGTVRGSFFEGELVDGTVMQQEYPEHSEKWAALFDDAELDSVERLYEGGVTLPVKHNVRRRSYESFVSFVSSQTIQDLYKICDEQTAHAKCGDCIVRVDHDWWLQYSWWPRDYDANVFEELNNGEISAEEYYTRGKQILDDCFARGET